MLSGDLGVLYKELVSRRQVEPLLNGDSMGFGKAVRVVSLNMEPRGWDSFGAVVYALRGVGSQVLGSFLGYTVLLYPPGQEKVLWGGTELRRWDIVLGILACFKNCWRAGGRVLIDVSATCVASGKAAGAVGCNMDSRE